MDFLGRLHFVGKVVLYCVMFLLKNVVKCACWCVFVNSSSHREKKKI